MSTNSNIGIRNGNKIKYIYCHWDGYLSHNGLMLNLFYRDLDKVSALINLGDISSLGYNVDAPRRIQGGQDASNLSNYMRVTLKTSFCVAYGRDRGDRYSDVAPRTINYSEYLDYAQQFAYVYDMKDKKWYVVHKVMGKMKEYQLDKLFTDKNYYDAYDRDVQAYESFDTIVKSMNDYMKEYNVKSVLTEYNKFLVEKGITDVEFDMCQDKKTGKRVYGLMTLKHPDSLRRTVIARSPCIGDLLIGILNERGKSFY